MPIYAKQSLQLLADLVNAANPSLPVALTPTNVKWGTPSAVTPSGGAIQDTSIKVTALASSQYIGNTTLTYRRINFSNLFRALPVRIDKYSHATQGTSPYKISDLLGAINAKYGLSLTTADIVDASLPGGNTNANPTIGLPAGTWNSSVTVQAAANSYAFEGSFTLYWVQAPQDLSTLITTTSLESARLWPGNRNVVDNTIYVVNLDTYSQDFTAYLGTGGTINTAAIAGGTIPLASTNNANMNALIAAINTLSGKTYTNTGNGSQAMDLVGATLSNVIDLSQTANQTTYPEADYKYFNRLLIVTLPSAASVWGAGTLYLHYNV